MDKVHLEVVPWLAETYCAKNLTARFRGENGWLRRLDGFGSFYTV